MLLANSLFSPRIKRAIPEKLKNADPLLSFQINMVEKKGRKKKGYEIQNVFTLLKSYVLNWISSLFLKCWVTMCSNVVESSAQKEFCKLSLSWVWFCVRHSERPSTIKPLCLYFSWQWRNPKSFCIACVQNYYILLWAHNY